MSYIAWLVVFVVFAALELVSLGLTCIWFAIGALAGCVAALLGANWIVQAVVFLVVTMVVLIFIRPFAIKYVNNKAEKTNVESMAGKQGIVIVEIDNINAKGMIKVDGMEWNSQKCRWRDYSERFISYSCVRRRGKSYGQKGLVYKEVEYDVFYYFNHVGNRIGFNMCKDCATGARVCY